MADIFDRIGQFMAEGQIAPTPANYEFWYRYATGADPDLVIAVDAVRSALGKVSTGAMANIRREMYGGTGQTNVSRLIDETERQLERMAGLMEQSGKDARGYREQLDDDHQSLGPDTAIEKQRALIAAMAERTAAMIAKTTRLEQELASSSGEIAALRNDLELARVESRTDPLTGLSNRKACTDYLEAHVLRAHAEKRPLSLVFIDIDHFKRFNDSFGHRTGDEVLRLVAASLERFFHGRGFPARWGGEEFVVVAPSCDVGQAAEIADSFRQHVGARGIRSRDGQQDIGRVTLSLGVAELRADEAPQQLIDRADAALYDAKADGRNCVVTADSVRRAA